VSSSAPGAMKSLKWRGSASPSVIPRRLSAGTFASTNHPSAARTTRGIPRCSHQGVSAGGTHPPIAVDVPRDPLAGEQPFPNPHPWKEATEAPFQLGCLPWTLEIRYSFDMLPECGVRRGDGMQDRAETFCSHVARSAKATARFE